MWENESVLSYATRIQEIAAEQSTSMNLIRLLAMKHHQKPLYIGGIPNSIVAVVRSLTNFVKVVQNRSKNYKSSSRKKLFGATNRLLLQKSRACGNCTISATSNDQF